MSASKASPEHKSFMERQYIRLNQSQGMALFNELLQRNDINSKFNLSILFVFLLCTVVHLMAVIFFALGSYVLITGYRHVVTIAVALLFFGIAWLARPRFVKLPRHPIDRRTSPTLYQVVDTLAENLGTHIDMIEFTEEFNASTYLASWRQVRVLSIGLPLWIILTNEEKAAIICHELAHNVNGDVSNNLFVGAAMTSLANWYNAIDPQLVRGCDPITILENIVVILLVLISQIPRLLWSLINILLWRVHQRGEYLADLMAAKAAGTNAVISLGTKLNYKNTFLSIVRSCALSSNKQADIFHELEKASFSGVGISSYEEGLPEELDWSTDPYHPPMPLRLRHLKAKFYARGNQKVGPEIFKSIDGEIEPIKSRINARLIDLYRASIQA